MTKDPSKAGKSVLSAARAQARASQVLAPQRLGGQLPLFSRGGVQSGAASVAAAEMR